MVQAQNPGEQTLYVVTHVDLMAARLAEALSALRQYQSDIRDAPGLRRFEIVQEAGRPNHLTLLSVWQDQKSFEANEAYAHTIEFRVRLQPALGSPFDERLHRPFQ